MKNKETKIAASALEQLLKNGGSGIEPPTETVEWNDLTVEIKRTLDVKEAFELVKSVVDSSFLDDGTYIPEATDFAMRANVISYYSNIELPSKMDAQYRLVYALPIYELVCSAINHNQLTSICDAVERRIDMLCDTDIMETRAKINQLFDALEKLEKHIEGIFGGVGSDDIAKIAGAINDDTIDEAKIVEAFLKADRKPKPKARKKK